MTPKDIIIDQIKDRFRDSGICNALITFNVIDDSYSVALKKTDNTSFSLDIDKKEISLIKMIFINKVRKKFEKDNKPDKMKLLILQINVLDNDFQVFIENTDNKVIKFEFN